MCVLERQGPTLSYPGFRLAWGGTMAERTPSRLAAFVLSGLLSRFPALGQETAALLEQTNRACRRHIQRLRRRLLRNIHS